jgi:hypothetical protein
LAQSKSYNDEIKYKLYRKIFKETAAAAEKSYYQQMFDAKSNSVKQLWHNLNEVCSFKRKASYKSCNIPKLINNNKVFTKPADICNELNQYFSTIGKKNWLIT